VNAKEFTYSERSMIMGWFATVVVGLIAGLLTHFLLRTKGGLIIDLILGVLGGFVGGWLTSLVMGENLMSGINFTSVLVALAGAVIVVLLFRLIFRRRKK
jgi:uncharacterized membrane protein YeaQ/YmgE (transglycosylase-associated protein family)